MKHWELFREAYSLEYTKRYSMKPVVGPESVAAHSYFVCLALMLLSSEYDFDLGVALEMAVVHDVPEMAISDVNYIVKQRYPDIAHEIKLAEREFAASLPEVLRQPYFAQCEGSIEANFVHYADTLQVLQYAQIEVKMGNEFMEEVVEAAQARCEEWEEKLKGFKK